MRKTLSLFLMVPCALFLVSCAAQFPFLASVSQSEMRDLQSLCSQKKVVSAEAKIADSLAAAGDHLLLKGKREAAFTLFDRASGYYRIALTKSAIASTEKKIAAEEQALAKNREDVTAYQQVLKELKSMEQQ